MRTLNSNSGAATPLETNRSDKKSVNTASHSVVNFLLGLAAVLMLVYAFIELKSPLNNTAYTIKTPTSLTMESTIDVYRIEKPPQVTTPPAPAKPVITTPPVNTTKPPVIVDNLSLQPTAPPSFTPPKSLSIMPSSTGVSKPATPVTPSSDPYNMMTVSEIPLFPGCDASLNSTERINCLNKKMARFVQRYFDTSIGSDIQRAGIINITVLFTIGTDGYPKDIQVRAPNEALKKEAFKTIARLPQMIPGKFNGAAVNTTYALPIKFKTQQ